MPQDGRLNYNILILCFNRSSPKRKAEKLEKNQNIEQGFFLFLGINRKRKASEFRLRWLPITQMV